MVGLFTKVSLVIFSCFTNGVVRGNSGDEDGDDCGDPDGEEGEEEGEGGEDDVFCFFVGDAVVFNFCELHVLMLLLLLLFS